MEPQQPTNTSQKTTSTDEQDLNAGQQSMVDAVKDTISSVVEKAKEITGFGQHADQQTADHGTSSANQSDIWEQASNLKDNIQQKSIEIKDTVTKKVGEWTSSGQSSSSSQEGEDSQKMKNWNESIAKVEQFHEHSLDHPGSAKEQPHQQNQDENKPGEGYQQKLTELKDITSEKLIQAKDVVVQRSIELKDMATQKGSGLAETAQQYSSQIFNKLQGEGEGIKHDSTSGAEQSTDQQQHTGLVATVSGMVQSTIETGKDLLEKAKDSISNLTTGTNTTNESELHKNVEPVTKNDNNPTFQKGDQNQKGQGILDRAATKIEEWTEGSLGEVSVVDPTKKNKDSMTTPGQPKEDESVLHVSSKDDKIISA